MGKSVLVAFGSKSDLEKFPNLIDSDFKATNDFSLKLPDTEYHLSIASAHRTPEVVERHAKRLWDAVIAGAGMCNALKDVYLRHSGPDAVLVALPMRDSKTGGLSSVLSSSEMPPGYPIAAAPMENLDTALRFSNAMIGKEYRKVTVFADAHATSKKVVDNAEKMLKSLGITYSFESDSKNANSGTVNLITYGHSLPVWLNNNVFFVASYSTPLKPDNAGAYMHEFSARPNVVHTGIADGGNLALYAARIVARHDGDVRARIDEYLKTGRDKYAGFELTKVL